MTTRRSVSRRRGVERRRRPESLRGNRFKARGRERGIGTQLKRRLVNDRTIQPENALGVLFELRTVRFVRFEMMRLEMAVGDGL